MIVGIRLKCTDYRCSNTPISPCQTRDLVRDMSSLEGNDIFTETMDSFFYLIHNHLFQEINTLCTENGGEYDPSNPGELGIEERRLATIMHKLDKADKVYHCDSNTKHTSCCEISQAMRDLSLILVHRPATWEEISSCRDKITTSLLTLYRGE